MADTEAVSQSTGPAQWESRSQRIQNAVKILQRRVPVVIEQAGVPPEERGDLGMRRVAANPIERQQVRGRPGPLPVPDADPPRPRRHPEHGRGDGERLSGAVHGNRHSMTVWSAKASAISASTTGQAPPASPQPIP